MYFHKITTLDSVMLASYRGHCQTVVPAIDINLKVYTHDPDKLFDLTRDWTLVLASSVTIQAYWALWASCHAGILSCPFPPFPQIDVIGAVVIVWRARGKIIRSVLSSIVSNNCTQWAAHTYEQTNSSLDWVLSCLLYTSDAADE